MKTQITTDKVRFSFCNLFTPKAMEEGATPKYSVTLLIPKTDKTTLQKIKAASDEAKRVFTEKGGKKLPANLKTTIHDGDGERGDSGEPYGEECKGCYVVTVSTLRQPVIVNADKTPLTEPSELYSGCYGRAVINAYVYTWKGKIGLTFGLNGVMKLYDGEPLGGGVVTDEDWDDDFEDDDESLLG